jgi:uncharacterized protein (TIGR03437 family)
MHRRKMIFVSKCAAIVGAPLIAWAFSTGPIAHVTAVPGTGERACTACHVGTALNGGGGSAALAAASSTYTPGQKQTITLTVNDAAAHVYGFEMTARLASDRTQSAGTFTPGAGQRVLCASTSVDDEGKPRTGNTCDSSDPVEFIEHSQPSTTNTITVDWTAPSSDVGPVEFYVSTNAANGNGSPSGDHIYTASLTLQPAGTGGGCNITAAPSITSGGIVNAGDFGAVAGVAPGTWVEIYGQNLAAGAREWTTADFSGNTAPIKLDDVSVMIGGKPAFLRYISQNQINVEVPDDIGTGPVPVVVTNCAGSSAAETVNATATLPGLLAPPTFKAHDDQYVVAQLSDGSFAGDPSDLPGTTRPVKPGDTIVLYGIGFGPVNPAVSPGTIATGQNQLTNDLKIRFGQIEATAVPYAGLAPSYVGLYQFNVTVPDSVPDGDQPLTFTLNGVDSKQTLLIEVKR